MMQEHNHQQPPPPPKYGNGNDPRTGVARASKKNKPKKIPQRGLGVAQLEKLRIEEQKKMEGAVSPTTPSPHAGLHGGLSLLPTLHPPPPLPASALPGHAAVDGGAHSGFLPMLWSSMDHMKHPYKRSPCSQPPVPMVSMGLSLTASSSHKMEPPSNQMYYSSGSRSSLVLPAEEERETAGVKRPWPFLFEGMPATTQASKAPPVPCAVRTVGEFVLSDASSDLSRYEFTKFRANHFSANVSYSDWRPDASCKTSKENGSAADAGFLTLSMQPVPLTNQPPVIPTTYVPEYSEFSFVPAQGSVSSSSSQPFYSFLPVAPVRCERALNEWKADLSDGVDLELKLWKS